MKMTFKAIARSAGYRVRESYGSPIGQPMGTYYFWEDADHDSSLRGYWLPKEQDAWEDCCRYCQLVEDV